MKTTVERTMNRAMTVGDLLSELDGLPMDAPVVFVCDYGDYCHTQQALPVSSIEVVTAERLSDSGYSKSGVELVDGHSNVFYCPTCDEEYDGLVCCPKCKTACVTEDGTPAETEEDGRKVVVLKMERD
jgi:hypothetical protein